MPTSAGLEVYNVDVVPLVARGATMTDLELDTALATGVGAILRDDDGNDEIATTLAGVADTDFSNDALRRVLDVTPEPEGWRVGEALAESFLVEHRHCEFPWPMGRDLRNPNASPAGTDLVGFQETGAGNADHRLAFGEVKTSYDSAVPPSVVTGRHGLIAQLEELRDSTALKDNLLRYLAIHAHNRDWAPRFQNAARRYLNEPTDVVLFGVLVRDTAPAPADLSARAGRLANGCPPQTSIELRAIYLPRHTIEPTQTLPPPTSKPSLAARARAALSP
jgi:hypothetical protein